METLEERVLSLFADVMAHCKAERKAKTKVSLRQLARQVGVTENYLSAIENGREIPSLQVFLKYLYCCGFNLDLLHSLAIERLPRGKESLVKEQAHLARKVYSLSLEQVSLLARQADALSGFTVKSKKKHSK